MERYVIRKQLEVRPVFLFVNSSISFTSSTKSPPALNTHADDRTPEYKMLATAAFYCMLHAIKKNYRTAVLLALVSLHHKTLPND
jgi:hypothetical protein